MTCRTVVEAFGEYLEAMLDGTATRRLERHVGGCEACGAYLNTYTKTRALVTGAIRAPLSVGSTRRVRAWLRARLRET